MTQRTLEDIIRNNYDMVIEAQTLVNNNLDVRDKEKGLFERARDEAKLILLQKTTIPELKNITTYVDGLYEKVERACSLTEKDFDLLTAIGNKEKTGEVYKPLMSEELCKRLTSDDE